MTSSSQLQLLCSISVPFLALHSGCCITSWQQGVHSLTRSIQGAGCVLDADQSNVETAGEAVGPVSAG